MTNYQLICIWDAKAQLGEGALYDPQENILLWLEIKNNRIFSFNILNGQKQDFYFPDQPSAFGLIEGGGYILTNAAGIHFLQIKGETLSSKFITNPEIDRPGNRFNDGTVDPYGGFWAGTMDDQEIDSTAGAWWRLTPTLSIQMLRDGFHVTNGPAFDGKNNIVYFTDSARRIIYKAKTSAKTPIDGAQTFLRFEEKDGYPDGMTIDSQSNLWVAFWDGHCIRKFNNKGKLLETVQLPVPRPTSIAIAQDKLFITSARTGLTQTALHQYPLSGGVFCLETHEALEPTSLYFKPVKR